MSNDNRDEQVILIELAPRAGVRQVSLAADKLAELSAKALDNAMRTIHRMAERVSLALDDLAGNPDEVEVEFGLKLDAEGQALIAKASAEAAVSVTLTWKRGGERGER